MGRNGDLWGRSQSSLLSIANCRCYGKKNYSGESQAGARSEQHTAGELIAFGLIEETVSLT